MLDLLKNKVMLSFIILLLVAVYFDSVNTKRLEDTNDSVEKNQITINNK
ncbi:MAG: hypothetical protein PHW32_02670 [Bacilli bacterium]|nr:hypothetical protein [Bacilli bacterium]MDD4282638.1 hypothetical protein [Bacilli bacterium]MDD4719075.1 hypothetical protein [Bacilli bacterium]